MKLIFHEVKIDDFEKMHSILKSKKNKDGNLHTENDIIEIMTTHTNQYEEHQMTMKQKKPEPVESGDHPPCADCGGILFLRTGTCHVCQTCGASQGCS